jgi:Transposase domain (DUF772)
LPTRLVAGLLILKHMHNLSDEALCDRWVKNPCLQYFCVVDTTVQEKAIAHPTDARLTYRAIALARREGIELRQSYLRVAKRAAIRVGRYTPAHQFKRARRQLNSRAPGSAASSRSGHRRSSTPGFGCHPRRSLCLRRARPERSSSIPPGRHRDRLPPVGTVLLG